MNIILFCVVYGAFLIFLGYLDFRKQKNIDSFTVANRSSSSFTVGTSMVASSVGGSATIGMVALTYKVGFPAIWWLLSGAFGLMILAFFLAKKVRQTGAATLSEMVEKIVGKRASFIASIIIVIAWSAILAAQFSASARILSAISNFDFSTSLILGALLVSIYALLGGQAAVLKSDIYQYAMVIISLVLVLFWIFFTHEISMDSIKIELLNEKFSYDNWAYYMVILGGSYVVCPMLFARLLSAKDENSAKKGAIFGVVGIVLSALIIVFIGLGATSLLTNPITPDAILTTHIFEKLPFWLGMLLLFGLFSAIISSADSCLITASSIFCHDIIKTDSLNLYRLVTFVFGMLAMLLTFYGKSILGWLLAANDIYVSGVVAPVFVVLLAYKKRSIDELFIMMAMIVGGGFGFIAAISEIKLYSFIGVGVSILLSIYALRVRKSYT